MYKLRLYLTGHTPTSKKLIEELKEALEENCKGNYALEVLDVFEHPEAANEDMILATPTLLKMLPTPVQRIVGDLKDHEKVLEALSITS